MNIIGQLHFHDHKLKCVVIDVSSCSTFNLGMQYKQRITMRGVNSALTLFIFQQLILFGTSSINLDWESVDL